jgi:hypothetical protein
MLGMTALFDQVIGGVAGNADLEDDRFVLRLMFAEVGTETALSVMDGLHGEAPFLRSLAACCMPEKRNSNYAPRQGRSCNGESRRYSMIIELTAVFDNVKLAMKTRAE